MEAVKENGDQGLVPASYIEYDEYEVMQVPLILIIDVQQLIKVRVLLLTY